MMSDKLKEGWKLAGDDDCVTFRKNGVEIKFDVKANTKKGVTHCIKQKAIAENTDKDAVTKPNERVCMDIETIKDDDGKMICKGCWSMTVDVATGAKTSSLNDTKG